MTSTEPSNPTAPTGVAAFFDGGSCFLEGARFLAARPRLLPFVVIPFCLTVIVFVVLFLTSAYYFSGWKESFFADKTEWYWTWSGAEYLVWLLFILVYGAFGFFTFIIVGSLITSPFSEYLSQKVEEEYDLPDRPGKNQPGQMAADVLRGIKHEMIRLSVYIGLWLVCLPLLLVPVLGQIAFSAALIFINIRYLAWDGLDYSMSRRRLGFRKKTAFLRTHRSRTVGYGAVSFALLAIPLTTLFVLPLNSIGGTILYCRIRTEAN